MGEDDTRRLEERQQLAGGEAGNREEKSLVNDCNAVPLILMLCSKALTSTGEARDGVWVVVCTLRSVGLVVLLF